MDPCYAVVFPCVQATNDGWDFCWLKDRCVKLPSFYSERQTLFPPPKFRDQKHFKQLSTSLLNLLRDTTNVFQRDNVLVGDCCVGWLVPDLAFLWQGSRESHDECSEHFWTSHQLSTMLPSLSWELEMTFISLWELGSCARFVPSVTHSALTHWVLLCLFHSFSSKLSTPPFLDSLCANQREARTCRKW